MAMTGGRARWFPLLESVVVPRGLRVPPRPPKDGWMSDMEAQPISSPSVGRRTPNLIVSTVGVILLAANMRASLTPVGPLIADLQRDLHLSHTGAGLLTTMPLLAFGLISPLAAPLARRWGIERVLFVMLWVLLLGQLIRPLGTVTALFTGTLVIGAAVAITNVLMPALVKGRFQQRLGLMTGVYTVFMNLMAALATGFSIPLARQWGLGWQGSLRFWALLTVLGLIAWFPQLRAPATAAALPGQPAGGKRSLWRSSLAWTVTIFFGVQAMFFYCTITWWPTVLQDQGLDARTAGWMLSLYQIVQMPALLLTPIQAERMRDQRPLVLLIVFLFLLGLGLYAVLGVQGAWLVAIILGTASGMALTVSMMFFTLRTRDSMQAAELSAMAQSVGYMLTAVAPPTFGWLHDVTGDWVGGLIMLVVGALILVVTGLVAGSNRQVDQAAGAP